MLDVEKKDKLIRQSRFLVYDFPALTILPVLILLQQKEYISDMFFLIETCLLLVFTTVMTLTVYRRHMEGWDWLFAAQAGITLIFCLLYVLLKELQPYLTIAGIVLLVSRMYALPLFIRYSSCYRSEWQRGWLCTSILYVMLLTFQIFF